ncbi:MAG: helix-turn-helix domain-containing protein [Patescibacteria group bacterium]
MVTASSAIIKNLGFTEPQAKVYFAAMELGSATIQQLAHKSGVKRTTIYTFIDELRQKNLLTETRKKKRNYFSAVHPEQLVAIERGRLGELEQLLPQLVAFYNKTDVKPRVTYYEGHDGIKDVFADTLREKKPIIGWVDMEKTEEAMSAYFAFYTPERVRQNITYQAIVRDTPAAREAAKKNVGALREYRFAPGKELTTEVNVYGHKVMLVNFTSRPPFGIIIEDPGIAATMRFAWQLVWDRLPD